MDGWLGRSASALTDRTCFSRNRFDPGLSPCAEEEMSVEAQVQQAVSDTRLAVSKQKQEIALQLALEERRRRVDLEAQLKKQEEKEKERREKEQEAQRKVKQKPTRLERMEKLVQAANLGLDVLFTDLHESVGEDLNIQDAPMDADIDSLLTKGRQDVANKNRIFAPFGDMSDLSDKDFVHARWRFLKDI